MLEEKELIRMYVTIHLTFDTQFYTTFIRLTELTVNESGQRFTHNVYYPDRFCPDSLTVTSVSRMNVVSSLLLNYIQVSPEGNVVVSVHCI